MLAVFPKMLGVAFPVTKSPEFKTMIQTATSGKETRIPLWTIPRWNFELKFNLLKQRQYYGTNASWVPSVSSLLATNSGFVSDDFKAVAGFFMSVLGAGLPWLYDDQTDNYINGQQIGIGDGSTTQFQITRSVSVYGEPIQNVNGTPVQAKYWAKGVSRSIGDYIIPSAVGIDFQAGRIPGWQTLGWPFYFICTTGGVSGSVEPNFQTAPMPGTIVSEVKTGGTAVWENVGIPLVVFVNGTAQATSAYTLGSTGLITFASAPALGAIITVVCGFYFQCRFAEDTTEFEEFFSMWWSGKSLKFTSIKS